MEEVILYNVQKGNDLNLPEPIYECSLIGQ